MITPARADKLPSLKGRGWGWVALSRPLGQNFAMPRVPPLMTQRARKQRNGATETERTIWRLISSYRPRFTRQLVVENYILDLACRAAKLAVEFDGSQHVDSAYDAERTAFLEGLGWRVIRFWNAQVTENPEGVAEAILAHVADILGPTHPRPLPSREGISSRTRSRSPDVQGRRPIRSIAPSIVSSALAKHSRTTLVTASCA